MGKNITFARGVGCVGQITHCARNDLPTPLSQTLRQETYFNFHRHRYFGSRTLGNLICSRNSIDIFEDNILACRKRLFDIFDLATRPATTESQNHALAALQRKALRMELRKCPTCGAVPGRHHEIGCDVEICANCGGQRTLCGCEESSLPTLPWPGVLPGIIECREFGWYAKLGPDGVLVQCDADDPEATEDLGRMVREAIWDREAGRFVVPERYTFIPCKFCGGTAILELKTDLNPQAALYFVMCADCEATGPIKRSRRQAAEGWNAGYMNEK